jgi:hypothetical protein
LERNLRTKERDRSALEDRSQNATPLPSTSQRLWSSARNADEASTLATSPAPRMYSTRELRDSASLPASQENEINDARLRAFREEHEVRFLALLREGDFEYGFDSAADAFVEACLRENALVTMQWIGLLFFERFSEPSVLVGILGVLAHLDYAQALPHGVSMAAAATRHTNPEVKEGGVRVLERWAQVAPGALEILSQLNFTGAEDWLRDYVNAVIADLRAAAA